MFDPVDGSYSVSFWFRHDGSNQYSVLAGKFHSGARGSQKEGWKIASEGNWLSMQLNYSDLDLFALDWFEPRSVLVHYAPQIRDGRWHHLVMVIDRKEQLLRGWLDNEPFIDQAELPAEGGKITARSPLYLGQHLPRHCQDHANCRSVPNAGLDEVRIYHRALSDAEIELLYLEGVRR